MRLWCELAQTYADRIIGLGSGRIVFDGAPDQPSHDVLTEIYGEEDWSTTIRDIDNDDGDGKPGPDKDEINHEAAIG